MIGTMITGLDSEDTDQSPQSSDMIVTGDSSSSIVALTPTETYTETQTYTETTTDEPGPAAPFATQ